MPKRRGVRRLLAAILLPAALPTSCLREPRPVPSHVQSIALTPLALPPRSETALLLGAFRLEGAWRIDSANSDFGSYSGLVRLADGQFLAISDRAYTLHFSPPGAPSGPVMIGDLVGTDRRMKSGRDAEAATYDAVSRQTWIAWEATNSISRHGPDLHQQVRVRPPAMRHWDVNGGAEALVRLADGRFIVLAEGFTGLLEDRRHEALLFPGDPAGPGKPIRFAFSGPAHYSPTDIAQLPDGRVLVLLRRAIWPMPFRFAGRIAIADPADIRPGKVWQLREVASLAAPLPVDNFEGMVVEPRGGGAVTVWLISDDNEAVTQRTLLWKLAVDPAALPRTRKRARKPVARPSANQQ